MGSFLLHLTAQPQEIFARFLVLTSEKESSMIKKDSGGIAQLASASDWQSEGQGFKSPYLHHEKPLNKAVFLLPALVLDHFWDVLCFFDAGKSNKKDSNY